VRWPGVRDIGLIKFAATLSLLELGRAVLFSEMDVYWAHDPIPFMLGEGGEEGGEEAGEGEGVRPRPICHWCPFMAGVRGTDGGGGGGGGGAKIPAADYDMQITAHALHSRVNIGFYLMLANARTARFMRQLLRFHSKDLFDQTEFDLLLGVTTPNCDTRSHPGTKEGRIKGFPGPEPGTKQHQGQQSGVGRGQCGEEAWAQGLVWRKLDYNVFGGGDGVDSYDKLVTVHTFKPMQKEALGHLYDAGEKEMEEEERQQRRCDEGMSRSVGANWHCSTPRYRYGARGASAATMGMGGYNISMTSVRPLRQAMGEQDRWRQYWAAQKKQAGTTGDDTYYPHYPYPQAALAEHLSPTSGLFVMLHAAPWLYVIAPHWTLERTRSRARDQGRAEARLAGTTAELDEETSSRGAPLPRNPQVIEDAPTSRSKLVIQCQVPNTAPIYDFSYDEHGAIVGGASLMEMCIYLLPHVELPSCVDLIGNPDREQLLLASSGRWAIPNYELGPFPVGEHTIELQLRHKGQAVGGRIALSFSIKE
jgi:hypothetical protein